MSLASTYLNAERRAERADDAYQRALDKAGEDRYHGRHSGPVAKARSAKIKADEAARKALYRMREAGESVNPNRNPATIRGWVKASAVQIVRNKHGQATALRIKT